MKSNLKIAAVLVFILFILTISFSSSVPGIYAVDSNHDLWRCTQERCDEVFEWDFFGQSIQPDPNGGIFIISREEMGGIQVDKKYEKGYLWHCDEEGCDLISDDEQFSSTYFILNDDTVFVISYNDQELWKCGLGGCVMLSAAARFGRVNCYLKSKMDDTSAILLDTSYNLWQCDSMNPFVACEKVFTGESWCRYGFQWSVGPGASQLLAVDRDDYSNDVLYIRRLSFLISLHSAPWIILLEGGYFIAEDWGGKKSLWHYSGFDKKNIHDFSNNIHNFGTLDNQGGIYICGYDQKIWNCSSSECTKISDNSCPAGKLFSDNMGGAYLIDTSVYHCSPTECTEIYSGGLVSSSFNSDIVDSDGYLFATDESGNLLKCSPDSCNIISTGSGFPTDETSALNNLGGIFLLTGSHPNYCSDSGCVQLSEEIFNPYSLTYQTQETILRKLEDIPDINNVEFLNLSLEEGNIVAEVACSNNLSSLTLEIFDVEGIELLGGVTILSKEGTPLVNGNFDCNILPIKYVLKSDLFVSNQNYLVNARIAQPCNICLRKGYTAFGGEEGSASIPDANLLIAVLVVVFALFITSKKRI